MWWTVTEHLSSSSRELRTLQCRRCAHERRTRWPNGETYGTSVLISNFVLHSALPVATLNATKRRSMSTTIQSSSFGNPEREVRLAWIFFGGTFVALILNGVWSIVVGTASPGADESELVQGWEGVLRNLPAYLLLVIVAFLSVWFATQGGVHGSQRARPALIASLIVLLLALSAVTRDAAEVVMTTRAATMAWVMFGFDVLLVGLIFLVARKRIRSASGR